MIDAVRLAEFLVGIPSLSGSEADLADELVRQLRRFCEAEQGPLGTVVGRLRRGDGPTLMLEGHMDTVPVLDRSAWRRPADGRVEDGVLWGRGAVDMKGAIAAQIAAAEAVAGDLQGTLLFVYVPHEETAEGVALSRVLDVVPLPDVVVLGEPTGLHLALGHRGRAVLRLVAGGSPAHASMPDLGDNAVLKYMELLHAMMGRPLPVDPVLGQVTLVPVCVSGGAAAPVVPENCWGLLDRRGVRGETAASILDDYRGLPVSVETAELEFYNGERAQAQLFFPAWWQAQDSPWADKVWRALGRPPVKAWRFSTDGVESAGRRGIPTVGYGPGDERQAHRVDEGVPTAQVEQAAEGYRGLLRTLMR